jgi:luciferase-like monooxygenase
MRPSERVRSEIGSWPGVSSRRHRFGGTEYRYGRRELGHLHGDRFADLPFPRAVRDQLISEGRAHPHHVLPASGWVTVPIENDEDVGNLIDLFRLGYERAQHQEQRRLAGDEAARSP